MKFPVKSKLSALYTAAARQAFQASLRNWLIFPAATGLIFIYILGFSLVSGLGLAGGFILGLLQLTMLTYLYSWFAESTDRRQPLPGREYLAFQQQLFFDILSVAFLIYIFQWLVESLLLGLKGTEWIRACVNMALLVLCNPLPETIYQKRIQGWAGLRFAFGFASDYFLEWFLPLLILLAPLLLIVAPAQLLASFVSTDVLLPPAVIFSAWQTAGSTIAASLILTLAGLFLGIWYMFFRAYLFRALESGAYKKGF